MDVTRKARRSDSLYYGEVSRRELCDIVANVESENKELLKKWAQLFDKKLELSTENNKLRELVRMMLKVAGVAEYATDSEWQVVTDYLRELGIEVDR